MKSYCLEGISCRIKIACYVNWSLKKLLSVFISIFEKLNKVVIEIYVMRIIGFYSHFNFP